MTQGARAFVWGGGGVFVASLALTAFVYLWPFGASIPFAGWGGAAFDVLLFLGFAAHHSAFARDSVKHRVAAMVPERLIRSTYVYIASVLLIVVCLVWRPIGGVVYTATGAVFPLLAAVQLLGVGFIAASVRAIDGLELAGIRVPAANTALQVGGPYRVVRHPLYLGWMLAVFGTPHLTGDRLMFAIVSSAYLVVAVPWEERSLERVFGESYRRYRQRVRWRVVPFVY